MDNEKKIVYLDYNATAPIKKEALAKKRRRISAENKIVLAARSSI